MILDPYGPELPPVPSGATLRDILTLREHLPEEAIQALVRIMEGKIAATQSQTVVRAADFGLSAENDAVTNRLALLAAIDEQTTRISQLNKSVTLELPDERCIIQPPFFLPIRARVKGASKYGSILNADTSTNIGHMFLCAPPRSSGSSAPQYVSGYGSNLALVQNGNAEDEYSFDLSQNPLVRIPTAADWSIRLKIRPLDGGDFEHLFMIGGTLRSEERPSLLSVILDGGNLVIQFRYNGQSWSLNAGTLNIGSRNDIEISWDNTAARMRVYTNGVLWPSGVFAMTDGAGSADGRGWIQYPWESMCIGIGGGGPFGEGYSNGYVESHLFAIHITGDVPHTANFTPVDGPETPGGLTKTCINFDEFYHGCLVGNGALGLSKHYFYPHCEEIVEMASITLEDFGIESSQGIYSEFASGMNMRGIYTLNAFEGVKHTRNGYFSKFSDIDIIGGGRSGWAMFGGSYCKMDGFKSSGNVPYFFSGANVFGIDVSSSVHTNCFLGMYFHGGTGGFMGFQVDAEEDIAASTDYQGAVMVSEPYGFSLVSSTLYNPPNKSDVIPVVAVKDHAGRWGFNLDACFFFDLDDGVPLSKTVGASAAAWDPKIKFRSSVYDGTHALCETAANAEGD